MLGIKFDKRWTDGGRELKNGHHMDERAVGRPKTRWRDEIERELGLQQRRVARYRKKLRECGEIFALKMDDKKEE